ncbi:hypothetical protein OROHE_020584 [Orobanche hederae]
MVVDVDVVEVVEADAEVLEEKLRPVPYSLSNYADLSFGEQHEYFNNNREQTIEENDNRVAPHVLREVVNQMTQFAQVVDIIQVAIGLQPREGHHSIPNLGYRGDK